MRSWCAARRCCARCINADFDYCNLLDDHSTLIDLLEKGRLKQAMDLIDTHHRSVVRGYIMDRFGIPASQPASKRWRPISAKADLTPRPVRRQATAQCGGRRRGDAHASRLEEQIRH